MVLVWTYLAFLLFSTAVGILVVGWALFGLLRRRHRKDGVVILAGGAAGALAAACLYGARFIATGAALTDLFSKSAFLWTATAFAWVGAMTAALLVALRVATR
jgi:hypothetical protein